MKICYLKLYLHLQEFCCKNLRVLHAVACARTTFFKFCQLQIFLQMLASDFPHIFCCLQIAYNFPGNYSLENCRQINMWKI